MDLFFVMRINYLNYLSFYSVYGLARFLYEPV